MSVPRVRSVLRDRPRRRCGDEGRYETQGSGHATYRDARDDRSDAVAATARRRDHPRGCYADPSRTLAQHHDRRSTGRHTVVDRPTLSCARRHHPGEGPSDTRRERSALGFPRAWAVPLDTSHQRRSTPRPHGRTACIGWTRRVHDTQEEVIFAAGTHLAAIHQGSDARPRADSRPTVATQYIVC